MIPKIIYTIWLNDKPELPEIVAKCLATHRIEGYDHRLITLKDVFGDPEINEALMIGGRHDYLGDCLRAKKWVKAYDFLRMKLLYDTGGIYLDADMEVLPGKNFDQFLDHDLFLGMEKNGIYANSIVGSKPGNPLLKEYLRRVSENFNGSGDLVFEPGVRAFADLVWSGVYPGIVAYEPDFFFPYDHESGQTKITDRSIVYHHFLKSWK